MATQEHQPRRTGLRERKKLRTRETIATTALRLFAEHGYDQTTLDDIADASDVSKRTIFSYYASKEDILFSDGPAVIDALEHALTDRPDGSTTVDALRTFVEQTALSTEHSKLQQSVVKGDERLLAIQRARSARAEWLIAASIARDLGVAPDDIRAVMIAAAASAAFAAAREKLFFEPDGRAESTQLLDEILAFLQAGIDRIQAGQVLSGPG
jgi:AcrR family transcriptional regulator